MAASRSSRQAKGSARQRQLLAALDADETRRVLFALLDRHPEIAEDAATIAESELTGIAAAEVAEEVEFALAELEIEDVWDGAGPQSSGEYREPIEVAWELVDDAVAPFLDDLGRRVELGRRAEATAICQGVLLGLYCAAQQPNEVIDQCDDALGEGAARAVELWTKDGRARARRTSAANAEREAMCDFVSGALPEWQDFLFRVIRRSPARRPSH